jgi:hypothetical protein
LAGPRAAAPLADVRRDRLALLRALTAATPQWTLVKSAGSALDGRGDIDSAAPAEAWPQVRDAAAGWAAATGRGPVLACRHLLGTLVLAVVEPEGTLVQIDVLDRRLLRGRPILEAARLVEHGVVAPEGYRRLTPGAEGVALLVLAEWRPLAPSPPSEALSRLARLLRDDPDGAWDAAEDDLRPALPALASGTWPRGRLLGLELLRALGVLAHPAALAARARAARRAAACPLLGALARGRRVGGELEAWLAAVREVHDADGGPR